MPRRANRAPSAAAIVFALLVLATIGAFAYAQRLKRDPLVLDRVSFVGVPVPRDEDNRVHSFTPNGDCRNDRIRIRFRTTHSDDGTVQVVKPGGKVVLTLAREEFLKRYQFHTFFWDGRQRGGGVARPGRYKLRVELLGQERTLVPSGLIRLHRAPPKARSACTTKARGGGVAPSAGAGPPP
ncbi:MAG: hypothetical protein ACOYD4_15935 [Solirubrobacterales bacterium]